MLVCRPGLALMKFAFLMENKRNKDIESEVVCVCVHVCKAKFIQYDGYACILK